MYLFIGFFIVVVTVATFVYLYYSRETTLAEAIALYETNEFEKAADMFKNYSSARPSDIRPKKYLAEIYFKKKEYVTAIKECISITVSRSSTFREKANAYALMAEMYIEQGLNDKAAKVAIDGFRLDPKNPDIHYQLGVIYVKTEKYSHAIKEFNLVLSSDRTHIQARMMLADLHMRSRDEVKAIFQYKRILEINPNYNDARYKLAKIYYENGELPAAVSELDKITDITGIEIDYYYMLSNYYIKSKNKEKSKEILEKIVLGNEVKDEKLTFMRYELAVFYEEEGKYGEAFELYERIRADIPRYRDVNVRIQKINKVLFPEEHAKMIDSIDYNALANLEFEDLFYRLVDKLGYKETKLVLKNRNKVLIIAVEKFKTLLQGKYIIQMNRSFDKVMEGELFKFMEYIAEEKAAKAIFITTATFTDEAIKYSEKHENLQLLDKVNIYETIGG